MSETRKEKAERLMSDWARAYHMLRNGDESNEPLADESRKRLLAFILETPDIPTPEPVALEDIVPGWYWSKSDKYHTKYLHVEYSADDSLVVNMLDQLGHARMSVSDLSKRDCTLYTAPSPAALMQMCREVVTAEEVPPVIDKPKGKTRWIEVGEVPPAVEVALSVMDVFASNSLKPSIDAQNIVNAYLAEHAPKETTPTITECGQCGEYRPSPVPTGRIQQGTCDARSAWATDFDNEYAKTCPLKTPKAEVAK